MGTIEGGGAREERREKIFLVTETKKGTQSHTQNVFSHAMYKYKNGQIKNTTITV